MGRRPRIIIEMPPRHGKSETSSFWNPVWFLENWPQKRVILCSYEADFAASWGRKVRNAIQEHKGTLAVRMSDDSAAANRWDTTEGGGMVTAGVGGPITGRGAHLLIVDDPVKNAEEANSKTYRDKVWDWWTSTAYTRLEPGGAAIVIMTRWHEDDLAGRLIEEGKKGGEPWEVLRLPAFAEGMDALGRESGEALCPERYDRAALANIERAVGPYVWSALYQQTPRKREGNLFERQWFEIVDAAPASIKPVRYWDLAATEEKPGTDPDWTAGALVGERDGIYYVIDIRKTRSTPMNVEALVRQTAELDGRRIHIWMEQEPGSGGKNTIDHYRRTILKGFAFRGNKTTGSKVSRADPVSSAAQAGNVKLVRGAWNNDFLSELEGFPGAPHDDQVDAVSGAFEMLTTNHQGYMDWMKQAVATSESNA